MCILNEAAMADSRESKLRRLDTFRRSVPHVSASALAKIAASFQDMPDLHYRDAFREARNNLVRQMTPYGPVLQELKLESVTGELATLLISHPFAQLYVSYKNCEPFRRLIDATCAKRASTHATPWNIVLYTDEIVPGNALSYQNNRKNWVVYFSFLELGPEHLCHEEAWFCVTSKRSSEVSMFRDGIAQVFTSILQTFFDTQGHSFKDSGLLLEHNGNRHRIFATLGLILQDGGAHKQVWCLKGDAGTRFCMVCKNLVARDSGVMDEDGDNLLVGNLLHRNDLDFATDEEIIDTVMRLAADRANMSAATFALREQACGFNDRKYNMMKQPCLRGVVRPRTIFCHDWCHAIGVHGVFQKVVYLLLTALVQDGLRDAWEQFSAYLGMWTWPMRLCVNAKRCADIFKGKRKESSKDAKAIKCTASDVLHIHGILACFVQLVLVRARWCERECLAFLSLADIIDLLVAWPLGIVSMAAVRAAVDKFLLSCEACGWREHMHPKFHWLIHLGPHLLSCFVHERKHRMVKRYQTRCKIQQNSTSPYFRK